MVVEASSREEVDIFLKCLCIMPRGDGLQSGDVFHELPNIQTPILILKVVQGGHRVGSGRTTLRFG